MLYTRSTNEPALIAPSCQMGANGVIQDSDADFQLASDGLQFATENVIGGLDAAQLDWVDSGGTVRGRVVNYQDNTTQWITKIEADDRILTDSTPFQLGIGATPGVLLAPHPFVEINLSTGDPAAPSSPSEGARLFTVDDGTTESLEVVFSDGTTKVIADDT